MTTKGVLAACGLLVLQTPRGAEAQTVKDDFLSGPIRVGAEYVLVDKPSRTASYARELAPIGLTAI